MNLQDLKDLDLKTKTILVTGSTDGVGRHVAVALGTAGAKVLIHGRSEARAVEVVAAIREAGNTGPIFYLAAGCRPIRKAS